MLPIFSNDLKKIRGQSSTVVIITKNKFVVKNAFHGNKYENTYILSDENVDIISLGRQLLI